MSDHKVTLGDMDLTSNSFVFTVSRDMAIIHGYEKPTPEEVERYNAEARVSWERSLENWAIYDRARGALAEVSAPLARQVLDLHAADSVENPECTGCDFSGYEGERPEWPCRTVEVVANAFAIELPTGYIGSRPGGEPHTMPPEGYKPFSYPRAFVDAFARKMDATVFEGEGRSE